MNRNKLFLIISREFSIRVKKKSFILTTILTPVLFAALIILPSLIMTLSGGAKGQKILVVDRSGICEPFFKSSEEYRYSFDAYADVEKIKREFKSLNLYALVEISPLDSSWNASVSTFSAKQMNMETKKEIESNVERAVEKFKLRKYNIDNLDNIMKDVQADVSAKTFTVDELGMEKAAMVEIFMVISYLASFMIYMFIFMFGSMVMRGVIEEKTNRVVEVLVSSVKPFELMLGKILGIGAVALVQFLIWVGLTIGITFGFQAFMGGEVSPADLSAGMQTGASPVSLENTPMNDIMAALAGVDFLSIGLAFIAFFLLGYLLYASMFSAVGSAVDNETDTQQLTLPVTLPLIIGLFIMIHTFQYPDSSISFWGSMIPFTSPMVMMARVPFGVPLWEMLLSIVILLLTFLAITYLSAKIYRIGILSYGKRAGWKDLWKWIKY
ncbi:MAG: ABC transporter permease [Bacteroidales bacterium]|nr:ABC transporter permease [Bacteroidales bacterium]MDD2424842.1 ABC transporter permease [Bacteroidales bacterium]MDD3989974.1 ABC transporter permease [Bacteroidales bacterium]MDD4639013.1 ABC transporter permease [Bacteroidales bacterium]